VRFDAGRQHLGLFDPIFAVHALTSDPEPLRDALQVVAHPAGDDVVAVNTELIEGGLGGSIDGVNALEVLRRRIVGRRRRGAARRGCRHRLRIWRAIGRGAGAHEASDANQVGIYVRKRIDMPNDAARCARRADKKRTAHQAGKRSAHYISRAHEQ
jgi:hypothetical protein